jgi:hypothetical protein
MTVSVGTGHNEYYPLYTSTGNAQNHVRRAHRNVVSIVGFLAIPKSLWSRIILCLYIYIIDNFSIADKQFQGSATYISYQDPMDMGARMTKAPMAHRPADLAKGK